MNKRLRQAERYYDAVRRVLLHDWDPIGVGELAMAQDEYDSYVWKICGLLMRRESKVKLFDHLWMIETVHMGLTGDREHTERVVERLMQISDELADHT